MLLSGRYGLDMLSSAAPAPSPTLTAQNQLQKASMKQEKEPESISGTCFPQTQQVTKTDSFSEPCTTSSNVQTKSEPSSPTSGTQFIGKGVSCSSHSQGPSTASSSGSYPTSTASSPRSTLANHISPVPQSGTTVCHNCMTTNTPLWRRDENGQVLCNACGLFFKLHGRSRPISLKTDVIKPRCRNRSTSHVKPAGVQILASTKKRAASGTLNTGAGASASPTNASTSQIAPQPVARPALSSQAGLVGQIVHPAYNYPLGHPNAVSTALPGNYVHIPSQNQQTQLQPQLAPQTLPHVSELPAVQNAPEALMPLTTALPSLPPKRPLADVNTLRGYMSERLRPHEPQGPYGIDAIPLLGASASATVPALGVELPTVHRSVQDEEKWAAAGSTGTYPGNLDGCVKLAPPTELINQPGSNAVQSSGKDNKRSFEELETKVSELELVNDLLQQRIKDLEFAESQARRAAMEAQSNAQAFWQQISILKAQLK